MHSLNRISRLKPNPAINSTLIILYVWGVLDWCFSTLAVREYPQEKVEMKTNELDLVRPRDVDATEQSTPTKRCRLDHHRLSSSLDYMQIEAMINSNTQSVDDILVLMVQSGGYAHAQVVHFCIASGIPLSRMLRLDLMRLNKIQES